MRPNRWATNKPVQLAFVTACTAVVWLAVLPRLGEVKHVRAMIDHNEHRGIDPTAKFYTELPMIGRVRERLRGVNDSVTTEGTEDTEEKK
jgi:hypothetical protein